MSNVLDLKGKPDAGICELNESVSLLQSVDFITPLVNDPEKFGSIAAANAFSDIYAMGGKPLTALNILCYPQKSSRQFQIGVTCITQILQGGLKTIQQAGALLLGGHTTDNDELIYGLAVTGIVSPKELVSNSTAKKGDLLLLTKPLGATLITVTHAREKHNIYQKEVDEAIDSMCMLNSYASELMREHGAHACTDITGFGLLGHLWEMCSASKVGARVEVERIPILERAFELVERGFKSSVRDENAKYLKSQRIIMRTEHSKTSHRIDLLFEAETSGGLLISVPPDNAEILARKINEKQQSNVTKIIGEITTRPAQIELI